MSSFIGNNYPQCTNMVVYANSGMIQLAIVLMMMLSKSIRKNKEMGKKQRGNVYPKSTHTSEAKPKPLEEENLFHQLYPIPSEATPSGATSNVEATPSEAVPAIEG